MSRQLIDLREDLPRAAAVFAEEVTTFTHHKAHEEGCLLVQARGCPRSASKGSTADE